MSAFPSSSGSISSSERNAKLNSLIAQRELLEAEANAIGEELKSPGMNGEPPPGIKGSLCDKEGFPRGDIDIIRVKTMRGRLAVINTDHKNLMKDIEDEVKTLHLSAPTIIRESHSSTPQYSAVSATTEIHIPPAVLLDDKQYISAVAFATLDQILPNSPACNAGLAVGDDLLVFGEIKLSVETPTSSSCLQLIPSAVTSAYQTGSSIRLVVRTQGQRVNGSAISIEERILMPKLWTGRGLLGLHLTPK